MAADERYGVTCGRKGSAELLDQAREWSSALGLPFIGRRDSSGAELGLQELCCRHGLTGLIVAAVGGPQIFRVDVEGQPFVYHPGMAVLRVLQLKRGEKDNFANALGLKPGMRVFDGTLGLAADAAIASYIVGETGKVVGTEASKPLQFAVSYGLQHYVAEDEDLTKALRRIESVQMLADEYLAQCAPDSFDVAYFDPMFRRPVEGSSAMDTMRPLTYEQELQPETLALALKVAPLVVIKERSPRVLEALGCTEIVGGKYSRIKYGIIRR